MHIDNYGSLCAPVLDLLIYLGIYFELGQEELDITLVLDIHKDRLEVLSEGQLLASVSLAWCLNDSSDSW